jgi:hypothetical protein
MRCSPRSVGTSYAQFGLVWKKREKLACVPLASFKPSHIVMPLFLQHLSWGSADVPALQVEETLAWEAAAAMKAALITVVLTAKTSA